MRKSTELEELKKTFEDAIHKVSAMSVLLARC
jgi:hypothetical protein